MTVKHDAILRKEDLLAIENTLYEPKKEELVARGFIKLNTNFAPFAQEIGYDWFDRTGSAKILAAGGSAKDVPFVGENGGRETMKVYDIVTGIRYTKAERMAAQAKSALGKGPVVNLDTSRVATARRFVAETENRLAFVGDAKHKIKGLLNMLGITSESVAASGTGAGDSAKRLWTNKTPKLKLADLLTGKKKVEAGNIFKARVLLIDSDHFNQLLEPFSDSSPMTVLKWLQTEGAFFEKIIVTSALNHAHNGFSTVDAFAILDNDPEIIELAVVEDLALGDPVYDILGTSEQVASERTAGCIIRHPSAIYVGKGI
ncbi:MAG TPA: DUF2184 domain-containing protein [Spirochaetota bacterium]|nr:DUF2184 domain-containing protein [Spirochaetota bacterium]